MADKKQQQEIKIEIQLEDEKAQGVYSNLAMISHTDSEFVFDFVFVQPQAPRAKVRSRVITSPRHAKRLLLSLQENLRRFEQQFGEVDLGPAPPAQPRGHYN